MIFTFAAFTLHSLFLPHHQDRDMFPAWMMMKICLVTLTVIRKTLSNSGCVNKILVLYPRFFFVPPPPPNSLRYFLLRDWPKFQCNFSFWSLYPAVIGAILNSNTNVTIKAFLVYYKAPLSKIWYLLPRWRSHHLNIPYVYFQLETLLQESSD